MSEVDDALLSAQRLHLKFSNGWTHTFNRINDFKMHRSRGKSSTHELSRHYALMCYLERQNYREF